MTKKLTVILALLCGLTGVLTAQGSRKLTLESEAKKKADTSNVQLYFATGHGEGIEDVAWSKDGNYIATAGDDKTIRIWEASTGKEIRTLAGHYEQVDGISWSPDAKYLASVSRPGKEFFIWDVQTGELVRQEKIKWSIEKVHWSPNGEYIALQDLYGAIYDVRAKKILFSLKPEDSKNGSAHATTWSFDGRYVATAGYMDKSAYVWDASSGREVLALKGHDDGVNYVCWSPDGKYIATASKDGTAKIWDVLEKKERHSFKHPKSVERVSWSPNGKYLATYGNAIDNTLRIFDVINGKLVHTFEKTGVGLSVESWSPDSRYIACGAGYSSIFAKIIDIETKKESTTLGGKLVELEKIHIAPDGESVLTHAEEEMSKIWSLTTGKLIESFKSGKYSTPCWSKSGDELTVSDEHYELAVWNRTERSLKSTSVRSYDKIIKLSPDGRYMAGCGSRDLTIYSAQTKEKITTLEDLHNGGIEDIAWSPDGKYLVSGDFNGLLVVWSVSNWKAIHKITMPAKRRDNAIQALAWNPKRSLLAIGTSDDLFVWNTATWQQENVTFEDDSQFVERATQEFAVTWTPDGKYLVSGGVRNIIRFWNPSTGKVVQTLEGHPGWIRSLAISADGTRLISGGREGGIRIWDLPSGELLCTMLNAPNGEWITYTPDGYFMGTDWATHNVVYIVNGMDIITIDQMYEELYRPDLIRERLSGKSGKKSSGGTRGFMLEQIVASGDAPNVSFLPLPASSSKRTVTVQCSVEDTGGGVGDVRLSLNGRVYKVREIGQKEPGTVYTVSCDVTLANGENQIEVYATNASGKIESRHAARSITWRGKTALPNLYVLALGVNTYDKNYVRPLEYAVPDASAIADFFSSSSGTMYQNVHVSKLLDGQVTKSTIISEFNSLSSKIQPDDVFVFYLAGHGTMYNGDYYFIPVDFKARNEKQIPDYGVSKDFFMDNLSKIKAQKSLIMFDTCNSGTFVEQMAFDRFAHTTGQAIIAASSDVQSALEGYKGHGVFTYAVLDGLGGKADIMRNGTVSVSGLSAYINQAVPAIAMQQWNRSQTPWARSAMEDFLLVGKVSSGHTFTAASGVDITTVTVSTSLGTGAAKISRPTVAVTQAQAAGNNYGSSPSSSGSSSSDSSSSSSSSTSKSSSKTEQRSRGGGNVMGIYIDLGKLNGPFYSGFAWDSEFYFFGGRHLFGGADLELVFAGPDSDYLDYTKSHDVYFLDANFVLGWSCNIWKFRPYVMGGLGYYQSFVEKAVDTQPKGFTWDVRLGIDLAFKHFAIGGQYKLKDYLKSGYVDVWTVSFGWTF